MHSLGSLFLDAAAVRDVVLEFDGRPLQLPRIIKSQHWIVTLNNYDEGEYDVRVFVPPKTDTVQRIQRETEFREVSVDVPFFDFRGTGTRRETVRIPIANKETLVSEQAQEPEIIIAQGRVRLTNEPAFIFRVRNASQVELQSARLGIQRLKDESTS